ncbi:MAG: glycosyltransferase family 4 protein [Planctomycetes bacterium]|nr:glycosyltransferase family 4 protein [Planctomycetota bacterium]
MTRPDESRSPQRPSWLCVAYAFPPISRSGTHRTLSFVRHLDRLGWDATVITAQPDGEPIDEALTKLIPSSTSVTRAPWSDLIDVVKQTLHLPSRELARTPRSVETQSAVAAANERRGLREWVSRLLMTPDSRIGWIRSGVRAAIAAARLRRPDVIYSTSPYMSAHLIALRVSRRLGLPWVADFRDPWRDNPFRTLGFKSLERWDAWLERRVLHRASHIICNTPTMRQALVRRCSFVANKCSTILNGVDLEAFADITPLRLATARTNRFVLMHCGQFYGRRSPDVWFAALKILRERSPATAARVKLVLLGCEHYDGRPLTELAGAAGVADCVDVIPPVPHDQALRYMAGSDALILAGADGHGGDLQIPNKLFEYLGLKRPILAALAEQSPAVNILREAGADVMICQAQDSQKIADAMTHLATRGRTAGSDLWSGVARFDRSHRAAELLEVFRRVTREAGAARATIERQPRGSVVKALST